MQLGSQMKRTRRDRTKGTGNVRTPCSCFLCDIHKQERKPRQRRWWDGVHVSRETNGAEKV